MSERSIAPIQGPHCLLDFRETGDGNRVYTAEEARGLVDSLVKALKMKRYDELRVVEDGAGNLSIYQIVATSHIIIHFFRNDVHADLFSCEPFDLDSCVKRLLDWVGEKAVVQYCQRNLTTLQRDVAVLSMKRMNRLTSNPDTFTHAMVNWYGGDEEKLGDVELVTGIMEQASRCLVRGDDLPEAEVKILGVDPIPNSWDKGGVSGGYVNILRQLTIHTFRGINGAYMDIMAHCFDLEEILRMVQEELGFRFYEVDAVYQRSVLNEET
jgi:S-adenosylmethionine/arginine decarboxylase-like enzyme